MMEARKPVWREGMLLEPQHLQTLDRHFEWLLAQRLRALAHDAGGFFELRFDPALLQGGTLALQTASGVMPSGLPFAIGQRPPDGRALHPHDRQLVYLALPWAGAARWLSSVARVPDAASGEDERDIAIAEPNLSLRFDAEGMDGFEGLPAATVVRKPSGEYALDPEFFPPCLRLAAWPPLLGAARELLASLLARHRELCAALPRRPDGGLDFAPADLEPLAHLDAVASAIPALRELCTSESARPEPLYLELARCAARLLVLAGEGEDEDEGGLGAIPTYSAQRPAAWLPELGALLRRLLPGRTTRPSAQAIPLTPRQHGLYVCELADPTWLDRALYLVVSGNPGADAQRRLIQLLKIGSGDEIGEIIRTAMPGVRALPTLLPPRALALQAGDLCLRIEAAGPHWPRIRETASLAIHQPVEPTRHPVALWALESA
jgi:type VI secretion system protein ImpJ